VEIDVIVQYFEYHVSFVFFFFWHLYYRKNVVLCTPLHPAPDEKRRVCDGDRWSLLTSTFSELAASSTSVPFHTVRLVVIVMRDWGTIPPVDP
jgi:hypothetical protein